MLRPIALAAALLVPSLAGAAVQTKEVTYKQGDTELQGFFAWDDAGEGPAAGRARGARVVGPQPARAQPGDPAREVGLRRLRARHVRQGQARDAPRDAQAFATEATKDPAVVKARFDAALDVLKKDPHVDPKRIAAIGYCFGGGVVLAMARQGVDLNAVVTFHGALAHAAACRAGGGQGAAAGPDRRRRPDDRPRPGRGLQEGDGRRRREARGGELPGRQAQLHEPGRRQGRACRRSPTTPRPTRTPGTRMLKLLAEVFGSGRPRAESAVAHSGERARRG